MLKNLKFTDKKLLAINNLLFERKDIFWHRRCCWD